MTGTRERTALPAPASAAAAGADAAARAPERNAHALPPRVRAALVSRAIDPSALLAEVACDAAGALTSFFGTVRDLNDGRAVRGIDYSAYEPMAAAELARIADAAAHDWPGIRLAVEHRVGTLALREISVGIAVSHAHRAAAFDACRFVLEEIKRRVPIWKREHYVDGERRWVDPAGHTVAPPPATTSA